MVTSVVNRSIVDAKYDECVCRLAASVIDAQVADLKPHICCAVIGDTDNLK